MKYSMKFGTKTHPVNIACYQMLILFSKTYIKRLWCVWELFTLGDDGLLILNET